MMQTAAAPPMPPPMAAPLLEDDFCDAAAVSEGNAEELEGVWDEGAAEDVADGVDDAAGCEDSVGMTGEAVAEAPMPANTTLFVCLR